MEMFGPDFEQFDEEAQDEKPIKAAPNGPAVPSAAVGKATKGKIAAKSTGLTYQFQIMLSIGVPRTEVKKFADPHHWLEHFPPICKVCKLIAGQLCIFSHLFTTGG
jgi:leucyl-tRNA synthetase